MIEKPPLGEVVYPLIGRGHEVTSLAILLELQKHASESVFTPREIGGLYALAANYLFHKPMTASAEKSMGYAFSDEDRRKGLPARRLMAEFRLQLPKSSILTTTQDHVAIASQIKGNLTFLFLPDSQAKNGIGDYPYQLLVWTKEALDALKRSTANVHLVNPPDLSLSFRNQGIDDDEVNNSTDKTVWIKPSGSGADRKVIHQIIKSLSEDGASIKIPLHGRGHKKLAALPATIAAEDQFYKAHNTEEEICKIIFPSEQIMHSADQTKKKDHQNIISLYPRGPHEFNNLVLAIKNGLTNTIIVSKEHMQELSSQLISRNLSPENFALIDPSDIRYSHFQKAGKWPFPKKAAPLAQTIIDIIAKNKS